MQEKNYKHLKFVDRSATDCTKWDGLKETFGASDLIAAWVADMDIECPLGVKEAILDAVQHNVYGYYKPPQKFYDAFISWEKRYHGYDVDQEWIRFCPGVVQSIYWLLQILTEPSDSVLILEPVYYPFRNAIEDTGRKVCSVPLVNNEGTYSIDFDAFEEAIIKNNVKAHVMCSPHNPVGRVWSADELKSVLDICQKHGVYVISDEIHQDLVVKKKPTLDGSDFEFEENLPAVTVGDVGQYDSILITLTSASKTFNLAGMQNSFVIIPDSDLRSKYDAFAKMVHISGGANLGYISYAAAFETGREWLLELRELIRSNDQLLRERFAKDAPEAIVTPLEGTYLQWIDLGGYSDLWESRGMTCGEFIVDSCGVAPDFGEWFGGVAYKNFIRLNLATSPKNIEAIADSITAKLG